MYAEVKMGHLYPTVLKIRLQWVPLHTATWKQGSMSHLLPCSQRHRHWLPQGSAAPTVPGLSHRISLQCNDTEWGEHQHAQLLAGCLLPPQTQSCLTMLTEKRRLPSPRRPGLLQENLEKLRAKGVPYEKPTSRPCRWRSKTLWFSTYIFTAEKSTFFTKNCSPKFSVSLATGGFADHRSY